METKLNYKIIFIMSCSLLFFFHNKTTPINQIHGEDEYLLTAEKMPTPVGGFEAVMKKITYPDAAQRTKTEGKVYLLIYVNESGDVDDVKIVKGIGMGCDDEAERVIKRSKFIAATDKGVAVKAKFSMAITFKL